ncbi:hypothetical protein SORBI_3008G091785 [Sorghum bicolor]|uniref:Uncharacterized protein n=1 Tax=Sorghum bicolor TaxID=4558 RepID=A0A1Z5R5M3_SORBI|nr:hypothetical protein SORBI_3008G091785 [Sorghum bicolor]
MLALLSLTNYQMAPALCPSNKITAALTFNSFHKLPFHSPLPLSKCKEWKQVKQTLPPLILTHKPCSTPLFIPLLITPFNHTPFACLHAAKGQPYIPLFLSLTHTISRAPPPILLSPSHHHQSNSPLHLPLPSPWQHLQLPQLFIHQKWSPHAAAVPFCRCVIYLIARKLDTMPCS